MFIRVHLWLHIDLIMSSDVIISVEHLSKKYKLGEIGDRWVVGDQLSVIS